MGPRPFSRGNTAMGPGGVPDRSRFNGAAAFQPRKLGICPTCGCVKTVLQWGRGLSAAETPQAARGPMKGEPASMGPRPFSRGNDFLALRTHHADIASMGPRPFSRGNFSSWNCGSRMRSELQWGRGLSAAETSPNMLNTRKAGVWLQWGRGLSAAETVRPPRLGLRRRLASMGPRPFSRGNETARSRP